MGEANDPLANEWIREGLLGQGGMGTVTLVRNRVSGLRFAMKQVRGDLLADPGRRRLFFDELQTWIGLPEHPNLAACRFFRTVGPDVAVFMDLAEAGTLHDWIASGRLDDTDTILDVAVQFAWGLQAAHECGVVHQDVKPANVLMEAGGSPRVADFGLASTAGSAGGMTRAYCSPEQAAGHALGPATDQWSFAVSVLEMFTGEVTWMSGAIAGHALEAWLAGSEGRRMPEAVAVALRRCFEARAQDRWPSMAVLADALIEAWETERRRPYPRPRPAPRHRPTPAAAPDRVGFSGGRWRDPAAALEQACRRAGHEPPRPERGALLSPRGRLVTEMATLREAIRIYESLPSPTDEDLHETGGLLEELAHLHHAADDLPGAVAAADRAAALWRQMSARDPRRRKEHGRALLNKAVMLSSVGEAAARPVYEETLTLAREMETSGLAVDGRTLRMWCLLNRGIDLNKVGRPGEALPLLEEATAWLASEAASDADRADAAGPAFSGRAESLRRLGRLAEATAIQAALVARYERAVAEGRTDLRHGFAGAVLNLANLLAESGDAPAAHARYDAAIRLWTEVLEDGAMRDVTQELARTLGQKADLALSAGDHGVADPLMIRAIDLLEQRVEVEAQHQATALLTDAYARYAHSLVNRGRFVDALAVDDRALAMFDRLVAGEGRTDQHQYVAACRQRRALAFAGLGDAGNARREEQAATDLLDEAICAGRDDLVPRVAANHAELAEQLRRNDPGAADELCDLGLDALDRPSSADTRRARAMCHLNKGCARADLGDTPRAARELDLAASLYREIGAADLATHSLVMRSHVLSDDLSPPTLAWREELIEQLAADVDAGAERWRRPLLVCLRTQAIGWSARDLPAALRTLSRGLELAGREPCVEPEVANMLLLRAHSLLDMDRGHEAHADVAACESTVRALQLGGHDVSRWMRACRDLRLALASRIGPARS